MVKYASNAFLATKISYINELANLCEKTGVNVQDISIGMGLDQRIGDRFLRDSSTIHDLIALLSALSISFF